MIKKIIAFVLMIFILIGLYAWKTKVSSPIITSDEPPVIAAKVFGDKTYTYQANALSNKCTLDSHMACAVEFAIKCTLDPDYTGCRESKLPKFIFMKDESLKRPTKMSFKIAKIKPIAADLVEIHTDSTCDGNWFGLCQGRIIYVLVPNGDDWRVKDIYALEI